MMLPASIFFDFSLPNASTWSLFSLILAIALFFKFSRILSVRNWDILTLFLLTPGLLILQDTHREIAQLQEAMRAAQEQKAPINALQIEMAQLTRWLWFGYVWLLLGSGYFLARCLFDLTLVRRPALAPNLSLGGLAWLASALGVCLAAVALRPQQPQGPAETAPIGKGSPLVEPVQQIMANRVDRLTAADKAGIDTSLVVERSLAILCHLAVVIGLVVIGAKHFQDIHAGMAAAAFYLVIPYTAIYIAQVHHVWPIALLIWAVVSYRRPMLAGTLLGLSTGSYFTALVFPAWLSFYRRRGAGRFAAAFLLSAGLSLSILALHLWLQGDLHHRINDALALSDWQAWKEPRTEGFWRWIDGSSIHWAYRIPIFIAYIAFLVMTAFWPQPKNLAHVLALSTASLIGIQFWYADQGGVYVLWYLPLLLLLVFRPNLSERLPPEINPESDRLKGWRRALGRFSYRILRIPEPATHVH